MDTVTPEVRSRMMSKIRGKDTKPEIIVRKALFRLGYRYRINVSKLPGKPDIVLKKHRKVVFVNGCFWHAHEGCKLFRIPEQHREYWEPKLRRNAERDKANIQKLIDDGWRVVVVWECWIRSSNSSLEELSKVLAEAIKSNERLLELPQE